VSLGKERADDLLADTEFFVRAALCKILMDAGHLRTFSGTAEDVRFSFERYRGAANKTLKERVSAVVARAYPPLRGRDRGWLDRAQEVS